MSVTLYCFERIVWVCVNVLFMEMLVGAGGRMNSIRVLYGVLRVVLVCFAGKFFVVLLCSG